MSRKVILYIAMSLDGYLADSQGGVNWLTGHDPNYPGDLGYARFLKQVDTVIMGYRTYHQVTTQLSPDQWVYEGLNTYVLTHRTYPPSRPDISFFQGEASSLLAQLQRTPGRGIWICGGSDVVRQLVEADLIEEYQISIIPTLLGSGIRLFPQGIPPLSLRLMSQQAENGILTAVYARTEMSPRPLMLPAPTVLPLAPSPFL